MTEFVFYTLAIFAVVSAILCITQKSPVASALWLVSTMFALAGIYVLLNAQFIAAMQVLVYAGAVMVLFLFVIMLLNLNTATEPMKSLGMRVAAVTGGGLLFVTLAAAIRHGVTISATNDFDPGVGLVKTVGHVLFTEFLLPFEVSSVLFLSAIVGVVMLAKKETPSPHPLSDGEGLTPAELERRR